MRLRFVSFSPLARCRAATRLPVYILPLRRLVLSRGVLCKAPVQNSLPAARRGVALVKAPARPHASPGRRRRWRRRLLSGRLHQGRTHVGRRPWRCCASCWTCATSPLPCSTASRRYGTYHALAGSLTPSPPRLRRLFICRRTELPALTNHVPLPARVQCLLDLANLYAATTSQPHAGTASPAAAGALPDRLALGYVYTAPSKPSSSCSSSWPEVRIHPSLLPIRSCLFSFACTAVCRFQINYFTNCRSTSLCLFGPELETDTRLICRFVCADFMLIWQNRFTTFCR